MTTQNPYFSPGSVNSGTEKVLANISCLKFLSVSGSVTVNFDDAGPIAVVLNDTYQAPFPYNFRKVVITPASGATATFVYGLGTIAGSASAAAPGGGIQNTTGSPEGVLDAANGQWAFDPADGALYINAATSGSTGWVQLLG